MMKKLLFLVLALAVLLPVSVLTTIRLPTFGGHPTDVDKQQFAQSAAFNSKAGVFQNRRPELFAQMRDNSSLIGMINEWMTERPDGAPNAKLPEVVPDIDQFLAVSPHARVIWFGHSTFLLNLSGTVVLVDPVFSPSAAPFNFLAKRFQPPVLMLESLPAIDVVLISHDHYDHLDMNTVRFFADKPTQFLAPLGLSVHLKRWGVPSQRIVERDWWESYEYKGVQFTALPAQHFSGRDGIYNNETLWASWALKSPSTSLFFSGDSGYDTHFAEIGDRLGPFDMAFLENGQYDEAWPQVHLRPHEAIRAHIELKSQRLFPIHWGMFELAYHTWYEPAVEISRLADEAKIDLVTPKFGEVITLSDGLTTQRWWLDQL